MTRTTLVSLLVSLLGLTSARTALTEPASAIRRFEDGSDACRATDARRMNSPCCSRRSLGNPNATIYRRGQDVPIAWQRKNHPGGIVELSVMPFADSDNGLDLYSSRVFNVMCAEQTCRSADYPFNVYGSDNVTTGTCSQTFTVPPFLSDGQYTVLFRIYGSTFASDMGRQTTDYLTCLDFTVSGGQPETTRPNTMCPQFKGSDVNAPADKCHFYGTGEIDSCPNEDTVCRSNNQTATPPRFAMCLANGGQNIYGRPAAPPSPSATVVPMWTPFTSSATMTYSTMLGIIVPAFSSTTISTNSIVTLTASLSPTFSSSATLSYLVVSSTSIPVVIPTLPISPPVPTIPTIFTGFSSITPSPTSKPILVSNAKETAGTVSLFVMMFFSITALLFVA